MTFDEYEQQELEVQVAEGFKVDSIDKAEWCMKKISQAQMQKEDNIAYVNRQIEKLQKWLESENASQDGTIATMEAFLEPWVQEQLKGKKKKSVKLPSGKVGYHTASTTIKDEVELLKYVKSNRPELIKVTESYDLSNLKKSCKLVDGNLITEDGEVVPGYKVEYHEEFYVK